MKLRPFICTLGLLLAISSCAYAGGPGKAIAKVVLKGNLKETAKVIDVASGRIVRQGAFETTTTKAGEFFFPGTSLQTGLETTNPGLFNKIKADIQAGSLGRYLRNLSPEERQALDRSVTVVAGPEGWSFQRAGDAREIALSDLPALPNGVKPEDMAIVFGHKEGEEYLQKILTPYAAQYPEHGQMMAQMAMGVYERSLEDPELWNIRAITGYHTDKFQRENPDFPRDLTTETVVQESPTFFSSLGVLSLREYMVHNGLLFPTYGIDASTAATIHVIYRRLLSGELAPEANNMLVQTYLHSLNARDFNEILNETENFIRANGRFPGAQYLEKTPDEFLPWLQNDGLNEVTAEVKDEVTLGMQAYLVTKAIPHSPEVWNRLPTGLKLRINGLNRWHY